MTPRSCPVCNTVLTTKQKNNVTCGHSCANTFFRSGVNSGQYRQGTDNYRTICFIYHPRECVVCGETNVLDVHHWDLNHKNNDPHNLIPLCPNHHRYMHTRHQALIAEQVNSYREQWLENQCQDIMEQPDYD